MFRADEAVHTPETERSDHLPLLEGGQGLFSHLLLLPAVDRDGVVPVRVQRLHQDVPGLLLVHEDDDRRLDLS